MDTLTIVLLWVVVIGLWIALYRLSGRGPVGFVRWILRLDR